MSALPSILDLGRHCHALSEAHTRIEETQSENDAETSELLWLDQNEVINDLILTMPAVTLADVAVQLQSMLANLDAENTDKWPRKARLFARRLRRVLISTATVTTHLAGVDPSIMGFLDLDEIHRSEFPLTLPAPGGLLPACGGSG